MNGWNVLGFAISALISALVAILITGKISSSLADRAIARKLRLKAAHALLAGSGREQIGWWNIDSDGLDNITNRLGALGEEAATVSAGAAEAFVHATQMLPIVLQAKKGYFESLDDLNKAKKNYIVPDAYMLAFKELRAEAGLRNPCREEEDTVILARDIVQRAVTRRDDALWAIREIYRNLLEADSFLAKVGRWLRIVDWRMELKPPAHYRTALKYAEDHLHGASVWDRPPEMTLEAARIEMIAKERPSGTGFESIDQTIVRRNITLDDPLVIANPRYGGSPNYGTKTFPFPAVGHKALWHLKSAIPAGCLAPCKGAATHLRVRFQDNSSRT